MNNDALKIRLPEIDELTKLARQAEELLEKNRSAAKIAEIQKENNL